MKKFIVVLLSVLFVSLIFTPVSKIEAANGPTGPCGVVVNVDAYNYYQPGARTVDFYATKPSSTCSGTIPYMVDIEKLVNGRWVYVGTVGEFTGTFSFRTPTKAINIDKHFTGSGTYRIKLDLFAPHIVHYGAAYSHSFNIHY